MGLFNEFNSKIKFIFGFSTDTEVANALGITPFNYSNYKRKNKIPYQQVIDFCQQKEVDLEWILNLKRNTKEN